MKCFGIRNAWISMGLLLGLSAVLPDSANAQLVDNYPGALCVGVESAELTVLPSGEAANSGAASISVVCPMERQMVGSYFTAYISGVAWVTDQHPSLDVCCAVHTKNPGGALKRGATVCSSGAKSSYQLLGLPEVYDPYGWSHFYISCTLPPVYEGRESFIRTFRSIQE